MTPFIVPTIFTAVNQVSTPVSAISTSLRGLVVDMAKTAAITSAAIGAVAFSGKALKDYDSEIANLSALTGASGRDLDTFKGKIQEVAEVTKTSSVEVAKAFTVIANNQPELLKDAEGLAAVTKSSIMLAQASRMELQPAGEAVTQILNQYGKGAADAAKLVDILAAGSVAGSSEIKQTADAIQAFGTVAANAGVKIDESVAMIELVSKFEKGTEAGVKLRNILLEMGKGYAQDPKALQDLQRLGVNISTVANTAIPVNQRLTEMSKIAKDNVAILHVFGKENAALATGLLNNVGEFDKYIAAVNTTGQAAQMAATNNDTLSVALTQLSAKWVNILTSSDSANTGLTIVKNTIQFLTDHMEELLTVGTLVLTMWGGWKASIFGLNIAMKAYNFVMGVATVVTGEYATKCFATIEGMNGMAAASFFMEAGLLGSIATLGYVGVAVAALSALFFRHKLTLEDLNPVNEKTADGFVKVDKAVTEATANMAAYNDAVRDYNKNQTDLAKIQAIHRYHERKGTTGSWAEFFDELPYWNVTNDRKAPVMSDFGINQNDTAKAVNPKTEQVKAQAVYGNNPQAGNMGGTQRIELHINNNTGHDVDINDTGAPGIKITSTTATWANGMA